MFKNFIIIVLLSALSVRPAFYVGNVVYYETHINEIIEKYCVNKDKPELQCNGQCHLAKQISAASTDTNSEAVIDLSLAFFPVYFQEVSQPLIKIIETSTKQSFNNHTTFYQHLVGKGVYRPPIV
ncbi:hypothetical protein [Wenyingzhuangia aestuarii]|uniref:hypothetical protein n=1 Tax=Wenyingzhuangia aestuarii TaxID=1647582 RepID=UPI001439E75E|nr:hypothetical protein [Wenyingzhuangia aestuarii]NJB82648.1 hypothetical protein [Wenyingzhuangia aestuarii]